MGKLMKYEIRGSYKYILGVLTAILIASLVIQYNIYKATNNFNNSIENVGIRAFVFVTSLFVIIGVFFSLFFYIVSLFKKELYEDRGYLTFTLPLTGRQILGAKILVGVIWYALLDIAIVLFNFLIALGFFGTHIIKIARDILSYNYAHKLISIVTFSAIESLKSTLLFLVLVYLSVTLSKVSFKNRKIGGLWFVIFLILCGLVGFLSNKIGDVLPYYLNLTNFEIYHRNININMLWDISISLGELLTFGSNFGGYINIFEFLTEIIFIILGFLSTSYLIENKIDL
ncbi:MAG TPA: hypothetical protein VIK77_10235 [Tissierellaceae bacterium]